MVVENSRAPGGCAKAANVARKICFQWLSAGGEHDWLTNFFCGPTDQRRESTKGERVQQRAGWRGRERKKKTVVVIHLVWRDREVCLFGGKGEGGAASVKTEPGQNN